MYVKQISVFLENSPGRMAEYTQFLGRNGVDLISLCVADTTNFGILRGIVADYERAVKLIAQAGYTVKLTDVLVVSVPDRPGGLGEVIGLLAEQNVSIEYLYSIVRRSAENAYIVIRVDDVEKADKVLRQGGVQLLSQEDVAAL
ncbi:MAG: ACT domain-containing protein [Clostridia bacterium]|nr:ACT domain-containing protein [Clostridia bacterium]